MTDPLSPAVKAVYRAIADRIQLLGEVAPSRQVAATALRAVADQVAPSDADEPRNNLPMAIECQRIRAEILAIAAELEALPND
jgi:hypothetical protein